MPDTDVKMVTLTIDGRTVEAPEGANLVDAAGLLGVEVPHYCYHPGLSIPANCRICQVEIEGQPRLAFGCRTPVKEGMVVHTNSPKAKEHQKLVQEFLLCNHPLDCPVCDKAGECTLQDYYMDYGRYQPVMIENKYKKHKATPIGPTIVLDTERCILCSRCVRFCDEITKTHEPGLFDRNSHMEIGIVPGTEINNNYSGNLVDICPVGALGDRDFRFKCRVWYLRTTKSICPGCANGCNIVVDHQTQRRHIAEGARVMRLRPRFNGDVNDHWMCDEGRYNYAWHDVNRLLYPALDTGEGQVEANYRDALSAATQALQGSRDWTVVLSSGLSNEDLFLASFLFVEGLGIQNVFVAPPPQGASDDILLKPDKTPNTMGAKALDLHIDDGSRHRAVSGNVWVTSHDLLGTLGEAARSRITMLVYQGTNTCLTSQMADVVLPTATCFEKDGTFTNFAGRVQRFNQVLLPLGDAISEVQLFQQIGAAVGVAIPEGSTQDIFDVLALREAEFSGMSYDTLGDRGLQISAAMAETR